MGRPTRKAKRKKSSESDSETKSKKKLFKHGGKAQCGSRVDYDVSDVIGQANGILYDSEYTYNKFEVLCNSEDSDLYPSKDIDPVFTPQRAGTSGDTGIHTCIQNNNMASGRSTGVTQGVSGSLDGNQFTLLMNMMQDLKKGQDEMKSMFDSKLDKFKSELMKNIDDQVTSLRNEISTDVQRQGNRIDEVMTTIQSLQDRMGTIEQSHSVNAQGSVNDGMDTDNGTIDHDQRTFRPTAQYDDTEVSVITSGLPFINGEDLLQRAQDLIDALVFINVYS